MLLTQSCLFLQGCWVYFLWDGCRSAAVPRLHGGGRAPPHFQVSGWGAATASTSTTVWFNVIQKHKIILMSLFFWLLFFFCLLQALLGKTTGPESPPSRSLNPTTFPNINHSLWSTMLPGICECECVFVCVHVCVSISMNAAVPLASTVC